MISVIVPVTSFCCLKKISMITRINRFNGVMQYNVTINRQAMALQNSRGFSMPINEEYKIAVKTIRNINNITNPSLINGMNFFICSPFSNYIEAAVEEINDLTANAYVCFLRYKCSFSTQKRFIYFITRLHVCQQLSHNNCGRISFGYSLFLLPPPSPREELDLIEFSDAIL